MRQGMRGGDCGKGDVRWGLRGGKQEEGTG